ncbi:MAG TPA: transglutaminaseTgpA domain-containing protein [Thermoanaerobaculia bacterium]
MSRRARELETLLLTMVAALPLYATGAVGAVPILLFHGVMAGIALRVLVGKGPELIPAPLMRVLAIAYIPFYVVDAAMISRSAIAASTHLVLFIAAYQPIEGMRANNQAQRMLTTALIFIASLATSTHITVILFVLVFGFMMFRQMMYVSHIETVRSIGRQYSLAPSSRSAFFYLTGAAIIGSLLFPMLPRVRNPFVQGYGGALPGASTGISETINLNEPRGAANDATIVARVWMDQQAVAFFTPLRLRGTVYDQFVEGEWTQSRQTRRRMQPRAGVYQIARPVGFTRPAVVEQQPLEGRLFLPVGTYSVSGVPVNEGPTRDAWSTTYQNRPRTVTFDVNMAFNTEPLALRRVEPPNYPVTPEVAAMARGIVGSETNLHKRLVAIERYFQSNFKYVQNPAGQGRAITVDEFLLRERRGHCEYFAAGMVALLTALEVPSRIVGGFHGGQLNPLTGYFTVRREDAHAWVEVWDGTKWVTSDPTPASLRPGNVQTGLMRLYAAALSDSVTYFWDRYVLTFGLTDQIALFVEAITRARQAMTTAREGVSAGFREIISPVYLTLLGIVVAAGIAAIAVKRSRRPLFELLEAHLKRLGIEVGPAMTMEEALTRLREQHPAAAQELAPLIALYEAEQFSASPAKARAAEVRKRLAALRV